VTFRPVNLRKLPASGNVFGASLELFFRSYFEGLSLLRLTWEELRLAMFILIFYFMMLFMLLLFMVNC
jgi:hypothetical protein